MERAPLHSASDTNCNNTLCRQNQRVWVNVGALPDVPLTSTANHSCFRVDTRQLVSGVLTIVTRSVSVLVETIRVGVCATWTTET